MISKNKTIAELFEKNTENTPNAIAIRFDNQLISYQLLNDKANQLAHFLISQGASSGTAIAIAIPHSIEMIISILRVVWKN